MKLLIQYGGNPNATDTEKWTPLVSFFGLFVSDNSNYIYSNLSNNCAGCNKRAGWKISWN